MPTITFQPSGIAIQAETGTELLDVARQAGVDVDAPCGGKGTCGNCAVRIKAGRIITESSGVLTREEIDGGFVLACRTSIGDEDAVVEVLDRPGRIDGQFSDDEDMTRIDPVLLPKPEDFHPLTQKICLGVPPPVKADGLSDLDRLTRALQHKLNKKEIRSGLPVMHELADALRAAGGIVTVTVAAETPSLRESVRVTAIEGGDTTGCHYGLAIDIGTTTIAVQLVDLAAGKILGTGTDYNGQLSCGLDIISRIDYARRPDRREDLRRRVLKTINRLIRQRADSSRIDPHTIAGVVISGNTTMIHLLLGLNPEYIRLDPFTPTVLDVPFLMAADVGIEIQSPAPVMISPAVGSYVGGDITAGILCTDLAGGGEEVCLFMDIGTNGEVVLGNGEFLLAAACSAGPAFEGGGIKCGMRAAAGAIEKIAVDPVTGLSSIQTIGEVKPLGICGSGMISLLAELLRSGWMDAAGKMNRSRPSKAIQINDRKAAYILVSQGESATGRAIVVDESDIENIIRAKASLYAACSYMLTQVGMTFSSLKKVYIAGGFGRFLDLDDAVAIGLLPNLPRDRFHFIGNASLRGSYMTLISRRHRERQQELAMRMTYMELTTTPAYMDQYTAALFLPHTDPTAFV